MVREDFHPEKMTTESEENLYPLLHLYNSKEAARYLGSTVAETKVAHKPSIPPSPCPLPSLCPATPPPNQPSKGAPGAESGFLPRQLHGHPPSFPTCGNRYYPLAVCTEWHGHTGNCNATKLPSSCGKSCHWPR